MSAIKEILSRCVLDTDFLEQLKSNPEFALKGYDITDRQREILKSHNSRVLELLGEAYHEDRKANSDFPESQDLPIANPFVEKNQVESTNNDRTTAPPQVAMQPTEIAVRLVPYVSRASDDPNLDFQLVYATHVDSMPESGSFDDLPFPPIQNEYGQPLPILAVGISIQPYLIQDENGNSISFEVQARRPLVANQNKPCRNETRQPLENPPSISEAVKAVSSASSEQRMAKLFDLIHEISTHEVEMENRP